MKPFQEIRDIILARDDCEIVTGFGDDDDGGAFKLEWSDPEDRREDGVLLLVIASIGGGWDHISVSRGARVATYEMLDSIKRMLMRDDEASYQVHAAIEDHVNIHPHCLHMWRAQSGIMPLPPLYMV